MVLRNGSRCTSEEFECPVTIHHQSKMYNRDYSQIKKNTARQVDSHWRISSHVLYRTYHMMMEVSEHQHVFHGAGQWTKHLLTLDSSPLALV